MGTVTDGEDGWGFVWIEVTDSARNKTCRFLPSGSVTANWLVSGADYGRNEYIVYPEGKLVDPPKGNLEILAQNKRRNLTGRKTLRMQWRSQGGGVDFKLVHDSIKPPVWSRRFVAKFD